MLMEKLLTNLLKNFEEMVNMSKNCVRMSVESLTKKDVYIAQYVINELEPSIDAKDKKIDDLSIEILARYTPEATDLRVIISILKIDRDLERIGDHARNIARKAIELANQELIKPLIDVPRMGEIVEKMIDDAYKSFKNKNMSLAKQVIKTDKVVDELYVQIIRELITYIMSDPKNLNQALDLMGIAKDLERIGDLATNIAEYTYFVVSGKDIRHQQK